MTDYRYFTSTEEMLCEGWPLVYSGQWQWEFSTMGHDGWVSNSYGPNQASDPTRWRLAPVEEQVTLDTTVPPYAKILEERLDALEAWRLSERLDALEESAAKTSWTEVYERLDALETQLNQRMVPYSKIEAMAERLDALEAWRDGLCDRAPGDPPWSDPPRQEARREFILRTRGWEGIESSLESDEEIKVRETRPTDREVWMREYSDQAGEWFESYPSDEGAVRFWREGE